MTALCPGTLLVAGIAKAGIVTNQPPPPDLQGLWRAIREAERIELLEGLPHPVFEPQLREMEIAHVKPIAITSEFFYPEPLPAAPDSIAELARLTTDLRGHKTLPFPLPDHYVKFCGGFHADYALQWKTKDEIVVTALVCFGCIEVRFLYRTWTLTADFTEERHQELFRAFRPLRRQRPVADVFRELERAKSRGDFKPQPIEKVDIPSALQPKKKP